MTPDRAYDLISLKRSVSEDGPRGDGWFFGLPPGITPRQWPLDPYTGYPLQHGFTLRLPEAYRCHGPDIVAVSFFSAAFDHNDGGPMENPSIRQAIQADAAPDDPQLEVFWAFEQDAHPKMHRFADILDSQYAAILLTEAEFSGAFCEPPRPAIPEQSNAVPVPSWLLDGAAHAYWRYSGAANSSMPAHEQFLFREYLGAVPPRDLAWNRAIKLVERETDPNAGKAPIELYGDEDPDPARYENFFYWENDDIAQGNYRLHAWAEDHGHNHVGGTMRPVQAVPENFSPFYIGFEEQFGGYNFGGGNAQFDFKSMHFDWACG